MGSGVAGQRWGGFEALPWVIGSIIHTLWLRIEFVMNYQLGRAVVYYCVPGRGGGIFSKWRGDTYTATALSRNVMDAGRPRKQVKVIIALIMGIFRAGGFLMYSNCGGAALFAQVGPETPPPLRSPNFTLVLEKTCCRSSPGFALTPRHLAARARSFNYVSVFPRLFMLLVLRLPPRSFLRLSWNGEQASGTNTRLGIVRDGLDTNK